MRLFLRCGLIRRSPILGRLVMRLPFRWFSVSPARLGLDVHSFVVVRFKGF
jgi:hypothetical protein